MEYIEVDTGKEQELRNYFLERMQREDGWKTLDPILQNAALQLYASTPFRQLCAYDEKVTCHSIFKPVAALLSGEFAASATKIYDFEGVWMHVVVDNQTGQSASFSIKGPRDLSADAYMHALKTSTPYRLAHKNLGFYRLDTPIYALLNGRNQESISIPKIDIYDHGSAGHWPEYPLWLTPTPDDYMMKMKDPEKATQRHPISGQVEWVGRPISDRFGYVHSFSQNECEKNIQDMLNDIPGSEAAGYRNTSSRRLSITRFQTILSGAGISNESLLELVNHISITRKSVLIQLSDDIAAVEPQVLQGVSIYPVELNEKNAPIYEAYRKRFYPEEIRSFIVAGAGPTEQRNRKECIHQLYQIMFGDTIDEQLSNRHLFPARITPLIKDVIGISKNIHQTRRIINAIDSGERIEKLIMLGHDLRGAYSRNEVKQGLSFYLQSRGNGDKRAIKFKPNETLEPRGEFRSVSGLRFELKECCALAKIPNAWISTSDGDTLITSYRLHYPYRHQISENQWVNADDIRFVANKAADFLVNAGAQIAIAQQHGDKEIIKRISREWSWLSKAGGDAMDRLLQFDKKMNVRASYDDLPRILHQFSEAVLFRAIQEFPNARRFDVLSLSDSELQLDIDELNKCASSHYEDICNDEPEWDDEEECYIENEEISFEEAYGTCSELGQSEVWNYIKQDSSDFRMVLELNHELHKNYSTLIQQMNEHSLHQISWTPFLSEPQNLTDDIAIVSIHDRLSLLSEGGQMGHCVFSYLGECAAGRSVILGLRKRDDLNQRIATVELVEDDGNFVVKQCYGPHNNRVDSDIVVALEQWVMRVNNGEVPHQLPDNTSSAYDDFYSDIVSNPLREGAKAHAIPYDTDAVYDAILAFERYTPQKNIEQFFGRAGGGLGFVFQESELNTRGYRPMKELSLQYQLPAEIILKVKTALSLPWFDDSRLRSVLPELKVAMETLENAISEAIQQIKPPSGKLLGAEELKLAQADYAAQLFAVKVDIVQSRLLQSGVDVERDTLEMKIRKSPAELVFASFVAKTLPQQNPVAQPSIGRHEYRANSSTLNY